MAVHKLNYTNIMTLINQIPMKKTLLLSLFLAIMISCKKQATAVKENSSANESTAFNLTDDLIETGVIYEVNIRQYSPEGTFNAFTKDLDVLKELGVKVIWVMPINPISEVKRKATDGQFTSEIEDEEARKKYLGSYYSVSDYKAINPEFGDLNDFKQLVQTAHAKGMAVIVDWVPNHTGWDHPWIKAHPGYYTQNEAGEIIDPINPETGESWGWTDVADLNYDNMEMRKEMIADMKYWVEEADIDGFRMDVAHKVPVDFFKEALAEMRTVKAQFMLAEAEQFELLQNGFDMQYAWEMHHLLNEIAKGNASVEEFDRYMSKTIAALSGKGINMNFITNHDENSWNGTLQERMPTSKALFTALIYTMPGMPLIYSGQEYDLAHRLKFFEKDSIGKTRGRYFDLLSDLGNLKNTNAALHGGLKAGSYTRLTTNKDNQVLAFKREKDGQEIVFVGNFKDEPIHVEFELNGEYSRFEKEESTIVGNGNTALNLPEFGYVILVKK